MNRHLSESELALATAGDLPRWRAWLAARHTRRCAQCSEQARAFRETRAAWRALAAGTLEPPGELAERIVWRAAGLAAGEGRQAERSDAPGPPRRAFPRTFALQAGVLLALALLALLLVRRPAAPPAPTIAARASATPEAIVAETGTAAGRQRVVMYTGSRGGVLEVSATGTGVGVTQADPDTGAITITRLVMDEEQ